MMWCQYGTASTRERMFAALRSVIVFAVSSRSVLPEKSYRTLGERTEARQLVAERHLQLRDLAQTLHPALASATIGGRQGVAESVRPQAGGLADGPPGLHLEEAGKGGGGPFHPVLERALPEYGRAQLQEVV